MQQHKHIKKSKTEGEKEDCFPTLVINIDQYLNEALFSSFIFQTLFWMTLSQVNSDKKYLYFNLRIVKNKLI